MGNLSWGEGELSGFSGSPMLELFSRINLESQERIEPVPVGVIVTGGNNIVRCVSINIVTDIIVRYLENGDALLIKFHKILKSPFPALFFEPLLKGGFGR